LHVWLFGHKLSVGIKTKSVANWYAKAIRLSTMTWKGSGGI